MNELSYLQAAAQYEIDTEIGLAQIAAAYNIKKVQLKVSEKYYFGDDRWLNNELEVGSYLIFPMNNLKIGYFTGYVTDNSENSDLQHNLVINMEF